MFSYYLWEYIDLFFVKLTFIMYYARVIGTASKSSADLK